MHLYKEVVFRFSTRSTYRDFTDSKTWHTQTGHFYLHQQVTHPDGSLYLHPKVAHAEKAFGSMATTLLRGSLLVGHLWVTVGHFIFGILGLGAQAEADDGQS